MKFLNGVLGVEETLLDLRERKEIKKDKKRVGKIIKDVKNIFKLKKKYVTTQFKVWEIFLG